MINKAMVAGYREYPEEIIVDPRGFADDRNECERNVFTNGYIQGSKEVFERMEELFFRWHFYSRYID